MSLVFRLPLCRLWTELREEFLKSDFHRASSYASAVLEVLILSVRLCVTRVLCDNTKQCTGDILTPLPSEICAESDPPLFEKRRLRQISAYDVSAVRDSEKSSIMTNKKSNTGFPTSRIDGVLTLPQVSQRMAEKTIIFVFVLN